MAACGSHRCGFHDRLGTGLLIRLGRGRFRLFVAAQPPPQQAQQGQQQDHDDGDAACARTGVHKGRVIGQLGHLVVGEHRDALLGFLQRVAGGDHLRREASLGVRIAGEALQPAKLLRRELAGHLLHIIQRQPQAGHRGLAVLGLEQCLELHRLVIGVGSQHRLRAAEAQHGGSGRRHEQCHQFHSTSQHSRILQKWAFVARLFCSAPASHHIARPVLPSPSNA